MFQLDGLYSAAQIRQFAAELGQLAYDEVIRMQQMFSGEQSSEYYRGLLWGYANAFHIIQQLGPDSAHAILGRIAAFIADRIEKMEA
jgi:hypothetical protein